MGWTLMRGSAELARLELQGTDMPWFLCSFHAEPAYADVEPLFTEQERLMEAEDWDGAERLCDGKQRLQALIDELDGAGYTAAAKCLADDVDALVVHLRYPTSHRRRWRSTNLLERSLAEVKRRTKVIGRFPGETSCLTLVWAVLDLYITHAKNGVRFSQLDRQRLTRIRHAGSQPTSDEEASAA